MFEVVTMKNVVVVEELEKIIEVREVMKVMTKMMEMVEKTVTQLGTSWPA